MIAHAGKRTLTLENRPYLLSHAAAVGKKEGEGPLGSRFDFVTRNDRMGQKSWELAESELQRTAIDLALRKGSLRHCDLDLILAGDLLNQCIGSFLASMHSDVPYLGQYGACSSSRARPHVLPSLPPRISARQSGSTAFPSPTAVSAPLLRNGPRQRPARPCSALKAAPPSA